MKFEKRIWKTGALAAAATVAFAIFAYRAAEWSRGINSEVIVLGQGTATTNPCGPASTTGTSTVQSVKVIPQIALGSFDGGHTKYSTVIQIVNVSGVAQNISGNFYKPDGSALDSVSLTAGTATITNGSLPSTSIAKDGVLVVSGGGTTAAGVLGWGSITACGGVSIATFFELRDGTTNVLYSRVGVAASPANMSSFVIPRVRELATGLDVGFALVNTGSASATLNVELRDAAGTVIASKPLTMGARAHYVRFANEFFTGVNESTGRSYQYLRFVSASPAFAAVALAIEGPNQTSFPVDVLQ